MLRYGLPTVQMLPQRKHLFHTPPSWVKSGEIFFITICCAGRKVNQLARDDVFISMTNALDHYIRAAKLWSHLFLAMPDHLHALMSFPSDERMDKVLRDWKRFIAKQTGVVWQDGFFDHRLRNEESFKEKAHYIRTNPVREDLVAEPEAWKYVWLPCDTKGRARYP
jgi:putative transposase